ncbi:MAG: hypothetical protein LUD72_00030 [Bacteroidales bacterium]|nr:hypothetical protein [Bacteroidales bacterium]
MKLTTVYSSPCVEALENLFACLTRDFFCEPLELSDVFYYGVFCKPETYANYARLVNIPSHVEFPSELTSECSTPAERLEYVKQVLGDILRKEIEKPEWMLYVEEDVYGDLCVVQPSTFLYLEPKNVQYQELGELLIDFLYSPNKLITMLR